MVEARETKVGQFELAGLGNENVRGFDVSVEHAATVEVVQAFEELLGEVLFVGGGEREGGVVEEASQVVREVFEDHEAVILLDHDLLQGDDVDVVQ